MKRKENYKGTHLTILLKICSSVLSRDRKYDNSFIKKKKLIRLKGGNFLQSMLSPRGSGRVGLERQTTQDQKKII